MSYFNPVQNLAAPGDPVTRSVVFVGNPGRFSNRMIGVFQAEFTDTDFIRVADPDALADLAARRGDPALVIVDADLLGDLLRRTAIYAEAAGAGILVLAYRDAGPALRLMAVRDGRPALARVGFLPLDVQIDVWLSVMRLLLCGVVVYPQTLFPESDGPPSEPALPPDGDPLTAREWEILALVAMGKQNKIIADELHLSEHTVKLHIHHVLRKVGVTNRTGAATWFSAVRSNGGAAAHP